MSSDVSISNQVLSWLGADPITSLADDSTSAKLISANYDNIRVALLEEVNWTFAVRWADLVKLANPPTNQLANAFPIPSTSLRIIFVGQSFDHPEQEWRKEGNNIVTNSVSCRIQYIESVMDPNRFSALFVQAFAQRLAADLAIPITNSKTLQQNHWQLYQEKIAKARQSDQLQGSTRRIRSRWLEHGRNGGRGRAVGPEV